MMQINDGAFFVDNSQFSRKFLHALAGYQQWAKAGYWEQDAMQSWRADHMKDFHKHVRLGPHNAVNSWSRCIKPESMIKDPHLSRSFVLHWAGDPLQPTYQWPHHLLAPSLHPVQLTQQFLYTLDPRPYPHESPIYPWTHHVEPAHPLLSSPLPLAGLLFTCIPRMPKNCLS